MADELLEQLEGVRRQREMAIVLLAVERAPDVARLLASHRDDEEAQAALRELLGVDEIGARVVMDMQFRRLVDGPARFTGERELRVGHDAGSWHGAGLVRAGRRP